MGQPWDTVQRRLEYGEPVDRKDRAAPGACGIRVSGATVSAVAVGGGIPPEGLSASGCVSALLTAVQLGQRSGRTAANWN